MILYILRTWIPFSTQWSMIWQRVECLTPERLEKWKLLPVPTPNLVVTGVGHELLGFNDVRKWYGVYSEILQKKTSANCSSWRIVKLYDWGTAQGNIIALRQFFVFRKSTDKHFSIMRFSPACGYENMKIFEFFNLAKHLSKPVTSRKGSASHPVNDDGVKCQVHEVVKYRILLKSFRLFRSVWLSVIFFDEYSNVLQPMIEADIKIYSFASKRP